MGLIFNRNNPLNIRYSERNKWLGQIGNRKGFCVFEHYRFGFRAARIIIKNYYRNGIRTISGIVTKWAPPLENPTAGYIAFVAQCMEGQGYREGELPMEQQELDLRNEMVICDLLAAMAAFETGRTVRAVDIYSCIKEWIGFKDGDECVAKGI